MFAYYQEIESGDYLCVDHNTKDYYLRIGRPDIREARATCITGLDNSMCTTSVSLGYLREKCHRVLKRNVPANWLRWITGE